MSADGPDPATPLWRAAQVFRLLSYLYATGFQVVSHNELDRPGLSWLLFGVLSAWTLACTVAYLQGFGRRPAWVLTELAVVAALIMATKLVASSQWVADHQSLPTTLWATNATISVAIQFGPVAGMFGGIAVMAVYAALKGHVSIDLARNATIVIELAVGLAVGMAAQTSRRADAELRRAAQLSASVAERERLARQVHDGVIQVLALVAKRGREIGGATTELADLAGEQERALRRLVSTSDLRPDTDPELVDIRSASLSAPVIGWWSASPPPRCYWKALSPPNFRPRWATPWITSRRTPGPQPTHMSWSRISATASPSASATMGWALLLGGWHRRVPKGGWVSRNPSSAACSPCPAPPSCPPMSAGEPSGN